MKRPNAYIENMEQYIDTLKDNIDLSLYNKINLLKHKVDSSEKLIHSLSAVSVLERGFAIVESNNKVITSVNDVNVKDEISIRMKDGKLNSVISEIEGE